ncbi:uncharacterized protein [Henckelia pumila]|uniref:uncharacterized protein n=1 Tax=Henckelia pumila TaxID=405737 RepID=UPI003C6E0A8A
MEALQTNVPYFVQRRDATGKLGLSSLQKVMAAVRMLAYDVAGDDVDEYLKIGASTALECLKTFCRGVHEIFSEQYLRQPTSEDVARLNAENARRGFPGMLGSIDCMHWAWKNYPAAWVGQYQRCKNDINVLERSNLFLNFAKGEAPLVQFEVNRNEYNMGYYLADGIYPSWAAFVKTIPRPLSQKHKIFARYQDGVRKDVERAFGVLQERWHIVRGSFRLWDPIDQDYIMKTCIILHNMIVEDEREDILEDHDFPTRDDEHVPPNVVPSRDPTVEFNAFLERRVSIRNRELHRNLQKDLIEHIWNLHGDA